jgi:uncharacterized tellurite resistance protein B-like protein
MPLSPTLKAHFLNLYHMAIADSNADMRELELLYKIGEARGIDRKEIDELLLAPNQAGFSQPVSVLDKIDYLYDLSLIAWADGTVDNSERKALELFSKRFGFKEENISQICDYLLDEASRNTPKEKLLQTVSENL